MNHISEFKYMSKAPRTTKGLSGLTQAEKGQFAMKLRELPPVDFDSPDEIRDRTNLYLGSCTAVGMTPNVEYYAVALGCTKKDLEKRLTGRKQTFGPSLDEISRGYQVIAAMLMEGMTDGTIPAIPGIFALRNNHGYSNDDDRNDLQTIEIEAEPTVDEIRQRWKDAPD